MQPFSVSTWLRAPWTVIKVCGELDLVTEDTFRMVVDSALAVTPRRLMFDLSDLTFIDSRGLGVLFEAYHSMEPDDRMVMVGVRPRIQELFIVLGLAGHISIYPTLDDALKAELTE
ncbi:hypothetical protein GCM10023193_43670 [Planotetraspora kaengkrachanensis]|uniref:Anti-sigma factor antagonist n=2 Tax=Planotetraspora kaengkrachanensis TaxID=575193 RepID=A0A8J3PZ01_9ACTN|nr:hypothetical protein Pka01_65900 [Planotetraspora kaengkrachanensis]